MASRIEEPAPRPARPASPAQREAAERLGASQEMLGAINRENAGEVLRSLHDARAEEDAPTRKQLDYLRQLGMPEVEITNIKSKAEASRLIDRWQPPPTESQLAYLSRLGVPQDQIETLRTKSEAARLIEQVLTEGLPT